MDRRDSLPAQEVTLEVEKISRKFLEVKVLNNVNFRTVEVEVHCFVGGNGLLF
jgi:ABC-type sugar transport system ATPase subunit